MPDVLGSYLLGAPRPVLLRVRERRCQSLRLRRCAHLRRTGPAAGRAYDQRTRIDERGRTGSIRGVEAKSGENSLLVNGHEASFASACARTRTPFAMSGSEANSSGRWLTPARTGRNRIAVGAIRDMKRES